MTSADNPASEVRRGAAEDANGAPVTETDVETSKRAPSRPGAAGDEIVDDASGTAGGASGGSGGGSGMPGHPDAATGGRQ